MRSFLQGRSASLLVVAVGVLASLRGCQALAANRVESDPVPKQIIVSPDPETLHFNWVVYLLGIAASVYFVMRRHYDTRTPS